MIEIGYRWLIKTKLIPSSIPQGFQMPMDLQYSRLWTCLPLTTFTCGLSAFSSFVLTSVFLIHLCIFGHTLIPSSIYTELITMFYLFFSLCLSQANVTSSSELKNSSFCCSFTFLALVVGPLFLPSIGMVSCNPLKDTNCNFSIISSGSVYLFDHKNCAWLMDELYKY